MSDGVPHAMRANDTGQMSCKFQRFVHVWGHVSRMLPGRQFQRGAKKREGAVSATCRMPRPRRHERAGFAHLPANCSVLCPCCRVCWLAACTATVPKRRQQREGAVSATCRMTRRSERCCTIACKLQCFVRVVACLLVGGLPRDGAKRREKREGVVSATCRTTCRVRRAQRSTAKCHAKSVVCLQVWGYVNHTRPGRQFQRGAEKREGAVSATCQEMCSQQGMLHNCM